MLTIFFLITYSLTSYRALKELCSDTQTEGKSLSLVQQGTKKTSLQCSLDWNQGKVKCKLGQRLVIVSLHVKFDVLLQ